MSRLIVQVEGVTEDEFVNELLAPRLHACGWERVVATRMGRARTRDRRHGVKGWDVVLPSIVKYLREDVDCCVTTLVDYYGLPVTGPKAWPGRKEADNLPLMERGAWVQKALGSAVANALGGAYEARRFLPFVIMHEFEALLFSDCRRFADAIGQPELTGPFRFLKERKSIIVTTQQKFAWVLEEIQKTPELKTPRVAFLIDEAHRSREDQMGAAIRLPFRKEGEPNPLSATLSVSLVVAAPDTEKIARSADVFAFPFDQLEMSTQ